MVAVAGGLPSAPGAGASDAEIAEYYSDSSVGTSAIVWLQVLVVATIAFLWFVGVIGGRLGEREPRVFGTVFLGTSILLAAVVFVGTALLVRRPPHAFQLESEAATA